jgi:hypothetical protein
LFALLLTAAAVALDGCALTPQVESTETIIAKNEAALSRVGQPASVGSMELDLRMKDGNSEFDAVYRVTRDGRMRIDIMVAGQRVYTEAYDGRAGWDWGKDGTVPYPDPHAATLWHGIQFPGQIFTLRDLRANGHRLEYVGRETIGGVSYYVLKITLSDGFETFRYVNPDTWMIERGRDFRAFHPAINDKPSWIETVWSDYRPVQGTLRSFLSVNTDLGSGVWLASNTVTAIKVNPSFEPGLFAQPVLAGR